ncbi:MAG: ATP-binding protein [Balneolaceae bacterium]
MEKNYGQKKWRNSIDSVLHQQKRTTPQKGNPEADHWKRKYRQLKAVHQLQNHTVRHFIHNIMSPLSAVSGYLELLLNNLHRTDSSEKQTRYGNNVADGLNEIGFLLEQLHDIYKEEPYDEEGEGSLLLELNWLVNEVKQVAANATELRASEIQFTESGTPVHVKADLFQVKLMIYNLVMIADRFSEAGNRLEIEVSRDESELALIIRNSGEAIRNEALNELFEERDIVRLTDAIGDNSPMLLGLKICAQISEQMNGRIILDRRDRKTPLVILTAPIADQASFKE